MRPAAFDIGNSLQRGLDTVFSYLPKIIAFVVILVIGYIVARVVKTIVNKVVDKLRVDAKLEQGRAGAMVAKVSPGGKPSHLIGAVAFWIIFVYALSAAIGALSIPALTGFMNQVLGYLPNVIAALLIFVVAAAISGAIVVAIQKTMGDTPTGKLVETVVPALVMAIAVFMILTQLRIAPTIVTITYTALIGMLALAGALAFGLGGREVAAQMWSGAYQKAQQQAGKVRGDAQTGKSRAQQQAGGRRDRGREDSSGRLGGDTQPYDQRNPAGGAHPSDL